MNELYRHLREMTEYPLSNVDIEKLYNIEVVGLDDIHKITNGRRLGQWVVFLPNKGQDIGHWVLLSNTKNGWEYFDSYGRPPPDELKERMPYIDLKHNNKKYQGSGDINTCGFHTLFRAFTQHYMNMNLNDYYEFMKTPKDHDKAVVFYVSNYVSKLNN